MNKQQFINGVKNLIAENRPLEAIDALKRLFDDIKNERLIDETVILRGRYKENERRRHSNTQSNNEYQIEANKINEAIINLNSRIFEIENISEKRLQSYFREVKTFPRSYFYQLLTILLCGAIISYILIERTIYDLKQEASNLKDENEKLNARSNDFDIIEKNSRLSKLIISMDSPNTTERLDNIYDPRSKREGRTNSDDVEEAIPSKYLFMKEITGQSWDRWEQIKNFNPELILIHYSCFYPISTIDEGGRFDTFLNRIKDCNAKVLIYSRQDQFKNDNFIRSWVKQKENEFPDLKNRLYVFKMFPELDLSVQNSPFFSFRHMTTKGQLQDEIEQILEMN